MILRPALYLIVLFCSSLIDLSISANTDQSGTDQSGTDKSGTDKSGTDQSDISKEDIAYIGNRIWNNECGGKELNLTFWNKNEDFPSMGIGHFIWYPQGKKYNYEETFPLVLSSLRKNNVKLPKWLNGLLPWTTRSEFMANLNSSKMTELRKILKETINLQVEFIIKRFYKETDAIFKNHKTTRLVCIRKCFNKLAKSKNGLYALIDYVNFKGFGNNKKEEYKGKGWGLIQVLEDMENDSVESFVASAKNVLRQRVSNAPKNEEMFIKGWYKRLETYNEKNI